MEKDLIVSKQPPFIVFWEYEQAEPKVIEGYGWNVFVDYIESLNKYSSEVIENIREQTHLIIEVTDDIESYKQFSYTVDEIGIIGYTNILPDQDLLVYLKDDYEHCLFSTHFIEVDKEAVQQVASNPHYCDLWFVNQRPVAYVNDMTEDGIEVIEGFIQVDNVWIPDFNTPNGKNIKSDAIYLGSLIESLHDKEDIHLLRVVQRHADE